MPKIPLIFVHQLNSWDLPLNYRYKETKEHK